MRRKAAVAAVLSFFAPGLGQICSGRSYEGAAILAASIVIGCLNVLFVPVFTIANPDPSVAWSYWIPRIGHDVLSAWSVVFWIWAIVDACKHADR